MENSRLERKWKQEKSPFLKIILGTVLGRFRVSR